MSRIYPQRNVQYTYAEIENHLYLRDSPCLWFSYKGIGCPIQTAHVGFGELLNVPGMAESVWRFKEETDEWIPVFHFVGSEEDILKLVDIVEEIPTYHGQKPGWWVVPKGFPREQYDGDK